MNAFYYILVFFSFSLSTVLLFKKDIPIFLKAFPPFLAISLLVELVGWYLAKKKVHTAPLYNIFTVLELCFYVWVLRNIIKNTKIKKATIFFLIGFPCISALNILFVQGIDNYNSLTYSLGCISIIFLSIYYFYELFNLQYAVRLSIDPSFWICTGLLFFYSVSFPVFVSLNLMKTFTYKLGFLVELITFVLNIILYSLFCIAFICKIKIRKSSSL